MRILNLIGLSLCLTLVGAGAYRLKPPISKAGGALDLIVMSNQPIPIGGRAILRFTFHAYPQVEQFPDAKLSIYEAVVFHPDATTRFDFSMFPTTDCQARVRVIVTEPDRTIMLIDRNALGENETCEFVFSLVTEQLDPKDPRAVVFGELEVAARSEYGSTRVKSGWSFEMAVNK